ASLLRVQPAARSTAATAMTTASAARRFLRMAEPRSFLETALDHAFLRVARAERHVDQFAVAEPRARLRRGEVERGARREQCVRIAEGVDDDARGETGSHPRGVEAVER